MDRHLAMSTWSADLLLTFHLCMLQCILQCMLQCMLQAFSSPALVTERKLLLLKLLFIICVCGPSSAYISCHTHFLILEGS